MMMGLRPILSEREPNTTKNGVPISSEAAISRLAVVTSTLAIVVRKNSAWNWPVYQTTAWPAVRPSSARITIFRFFHWPKDSVSGALEVLPSDFIFWKAGDSARLRRIHTETASSRMETRNGMRQPQAAHSFGSIDSRTPRITSRDMNRPSVAVVWIHEV